MSAMLEDTKIGKVISNKNGKDYTLLAMKGDRALLHGGFDYVVIEELEYFEKTGYWGNCKYFPCFEDETSGKQLKKALLYFLDENEDA